MLLPRMIHQRNGPLPSADLATHQTPLPATWPSSLVSTLFSCPCHPSTSRQCPTYPATRRRSTGLARGYWRDVAGWQGTLDSVEDGAGTKTWWVAKNDLGRGPFRWRVYRSQTGWLLITSEQFYLPGLNGGAVTVEVSLGP